MQPRGLERPALRCGSGPLSLDQARRLTPPFDTRSGADVGSPHVNHSSPPKGLLEDSSQAKREVSKSFDESVCPSCRQADPAYRHLELYGVRCPRTDAGYGTRSFAYGIQALVRQIGAVVGSATTRNQGNGPLEWRRTRTPYSVLWAS